MLMYKAKKKQQQHLSISFLEKGNNKKNITNNNEVYWCSLALE
jgi:hypothetical protein